MALTSFDLFRVKPKITEHHLTILSMPFNMKPAEDYKYRTIVVCNIFFSQPFYFVF